MNFNRISKLLKTILPGIIVAGLIFGANLYYDLDLGKVIVNEITRIIGMFETTATTTLATVSGYVGIKTATPTEALTVAGNILSTGNLTISGGQITGANAEQLLLGVTNDIVNVVRGGSTYIVCDSSGNCQSSTGGYIGGSGTSGYIPKFTGTYTIGNSIIYDTGTNVGIGTTEPAYKLAVNGDLYVSATSTLGSATSTPVIFGGYVQSNIIPFFDNQYTLGLSNYRWANIFAATGTFGETITIGTNTIQGSATTTLFTTGNANQLVLGANGNVGIGTTSPSQKLHVVGNALITGTGTFQTSPLTIGNLVLSHTGLTASRTFTFPDVSDTLVSLTATQTLTNKTLSTGSTWQGNVITTQYGGTGQNWSTVATGSLPYFSGYGTLGTLALGSPGTILTASTSAPYWASLSSLSIPTGTGSTNYITKWLDANTLTYSSAIYESGGNVGIGTTTLNAKLTISAAGTQLRLAYSGSYYSDLKVDESGNLILNPTSGKVRVSYGSGYTELAYTGTKGTLITSAGDIEIGVMGFPIYLEEITFISASSSSSTLTVTQSGTGYAATFMGGNVGIGTTTPNYKLTVNGDLYVSATSTLGSATSTPVIFGGYVQSNIIPFFDNQYTLGLSNYRWANIFAATGTFGGTITIGTNTIQGSATTTLFTTGNANQLVLGANGNVGIGTTAPAYKLDVSGDLRVTGQTIFGGVAYTWPSSAGSSGQVLTTDGTGNLSWTSAAGGVSGSGTQNYLAKWTATTTLGNSIITDNGTLVTISGQLQTTGTTTLATSSGNVGIGTTAPSYKLTVNGDLYVSATSTLGSATSTPVIFGGYVQSNIIPFFDNQYTLGLSNYRWANIFAATGTFGGTITIGTNTIQGSATTTLFTTGNANQLVLGANGNVGIGTAEPVSLLELYKTRCFTDFNNHCCNLYNLFSPNCIQNRSNSLNSIHLRS